MDMRLRLYFDQFGQIPIPVPPRPEQDQIVAYLRAQDAHMARFIKTKRDLIKLLTEQKLRIIDHAVTRGLDSSVALKPSGIEWLGEVPEHWEVQRLKNVANVVLGKMLTTEAKAGDGDFKPYLRSTNVQWIKPDVRDVKEMWVAKAEMAQLRVRKGDLLVSEGGEVGRACMWNDELRRKKISALIPPRKGAGYWPGEYADRNRAVANQRMTGSNARWKWTTDYNRRSIAETAMYRVKQLFGGSLTLRDYDGQVAEAMALVRALNKMTKAGMPESVRIA